MKRIFISVMAISMMFFLVLPVLAGAPEETGRQWVERLIGEGIVAEIQPEAAQGYYIDLIINAQDWASLMVITNWDTRSEINVITDFIPSDGTPRDRVVRVHTIGPNEVAYLTESELGFSYRRTTWYGVAIADDVQVWWSLGVILYHSEYGLIWIKGDGPYLW